MYYAPLDVERVGLHEERTLRAEQAKDLFLPDDLDLPREQLLDRAYLLERRERSLASPDLSLAGYRNGAATIPDETYVQERPGSSVVISTEHATFHYRKLVNGDEIKELEPETGIAALASLAADELAATHITLLGRQTGDANHDASHPYKNRIINLVDSCAANTFVSLHGMTASHTTDLEADRNHDIAIGVGSDPGPRTIEIANRIVEISSKYGVLADINPQFVKLRQNDGLTEVRLEDDGSIKPVVFAASRGRTTRRTVEVRAADQPKDMAALQIEFSSNLRLKEKEVCRGWRPVYLGTYIGFRILVESLG